MIFHDPKNGWTTLAACWKRATRVENAVTISGARFLKSHPLEAAFKNAMWACAADPSSRLFYLDWFAQRVDTYLQAHLLDGDMALAKMLRSWKAKMFCDPTRLTRGVA